MFLFSSSVLGITLSGAASTPFCGRHWSPFCTPPRCSRTWTSSTRATSGAPCSSLLRAARSLVETMGHRHRSLYAIAARRDRARRRGFLWPVSACHAVARRSARSPLVAPCGVPGANSRPADRCGSNQSKAELIKEETVETDERSAEPGNAPNRQNQPAALRGVSASEAFTAACGDREPTGAAPCDAFPAALCGAQCLAQTALAIEEDTLTAARGAPACTWEALWPTFVSAFQMTAQSLELLAGGSVPPGTLAPGNWIMPGLAFSRPAGVPEAKLAAVTADLTAKPCGSEAALAPILERLAALEAASAASPRPEAVRGEHARHPGPTSGNIGDPKRSTG